MVRFASASLLALGLLTAPLSAQQAPEQSDAPPPQSTPLPPVPDAGPKKSAGFGEDKRRAVDELLGRLSKTEEPEAAKRIAGAVQALWLRSGSDTIDLLTSRAADAQRASKLDVAIRIMDEVVSLKPDYAEGWNKRATLKFMAKDLDESMADIHETLLREPRHYGAWIGLGRILSDAGFDAKALAAYRKAIEIYPAVEGLKKQVDDLALKVEGQPI